MFKCQSREESRVSGPGVVDHGRLFRHWRCDCRSARRTRRELDPLSGRNETALAAVARAAGDRSLVLPFEATDFDLIDRLVDQAWRWACERSEGVYGLVNNAGISQRSLAIETKFAVYQRLIAIDLLAPIALTQALLPRMASHRSYGKCLIW